jgi:Fe2+ transport system protein FeoA
MVVQHLQGPEDDCRRLREMGFREHARVQMICHGGAVIAQVHDAKVCLSHRMAAAILVAPAS